MMLAGIEAVIVAVIWIAIGSVFSALSTANAWPISALITVWPDITAFINAWQQNSKYTFRFIVGPYLTCRLAAAVLVWSGYPDAGSRGHSPVQEGRCFLLRGCRVPKLHLGVLAMSALRPERWRIRRSRYVQRHLRLVRDGHDRICL